MLAYDAILLVSFGGPERAEDVIPFLRNVVRGRNVPEKRILEVAQHYYHLGGVSPLNASCRALIEALRREMAERAWQLPVYWGNRNWHPFLADTLRIMRSDGIRRSVAIITSAFSCYSSCRQYLENIAAAQQAVGDGAPQVDRIRPFFNHPKFVEAWIDRVQEAWQQIPQDQRAETEVLFTAHSIPLSMASGCAYERQLTDVARIIADRLGLRRWQLVYQSRSGSPHQPWLEPDVVDYVDQRRRAVRLPAVLVVPLGFLSDHVEVVYDLDIELAQHCRQWGITMVRARTLETHPLFVSGLLDLVEERLGLRSERPVVGALPPAPADCPEGCCPKECSLQEAAFTRSEAPTNPAPQS